MQKKLFSIVVSLAAASVAQAGNVSNAMLSNTAKDPKSVLSFGMGTEGQRFSPLTIVNTKNVSKLVPAWSMSFGGEKQRGQESQPLIHDGKMFVTASYSRIFAIDLKTGSKLWKYEHRLPDGIMPCCDVVNRGAALYGNLVKPIAVGVIHPRQHRGRRLSVHTAHQRFVGKWAPGVQVHDGLERHREIERKLRLVATGSTAQGLKGLGEHCGNHGVMISSQHLGCIFTHPATGQIPQPPWPAAGPARSPCLRRRQIAPPARRSAASFGRAALPTG